MSLYDGVFVPGGHAPMVDLYRDGDMGRLLTDAVGTQKIVGAVCHGPAALLSATRDDGSWLFAGRRLSAVTDEEEREFGTGEGAPWLLASRLREAGAVVEGGPSWQAYVVQDGRLITGRNPASAGRLADAMLAFPTRNWTPIAVGNVRRDFKRLCRRAGIDDADDWTTYDLRHSFASLVSDQVDDPTKVADLMGHTSTRTTDGYRHQVRLALPHAIGAWDQLLHEADTRRRKKQASPSGKAA